MTLSPGEGGSYSPDERKLPAPLDSHQEEVALALRMRGGYQLRLTLSPGEGGYIFPDERRLPASLGTLTRRRWLCSPVEWRLPAALDTLTRRKWLLLSG